MKRFMVQHSFACNSPRRGFTLVEMLVAVGLVVLMMTLFASIFQFATQSMSVQKGSAENDQRTRLVMTLLRGDLNNRTMKFVQPFLQDEDLNLPNNNVALRQGYLYIAENDPNDDTDDNIQFTVQVGPSDDLYVGAARFLMLDGSLRYGQNNNPTYPGYPSNSNTVPTSGFPQIANPGFYWTNQPEFDDQLVGIPNGAGASTTAEVSYFLRKGTLYRRVLLVRTPPAGANDPTPKDNLSNPLSTIPFDGGFNNPRNFYTYFDYSAYLGPGGLTFHGTGSLNNGSGGTRFPLAKPNFRFGHDLYLGLPREYLPDVNDPNNVTHYIGRFTHEETSYMNIGGGGIEMFGYPGQWTGPNGMAPNPMDTSGNSPLRYDPTTGKVPQYNTGPPNTRPRAGEDILMTNVHRFDIKVFDDAASLGPDQQPGVAGVNDDGQNNGADDASEIGWPGSDDGDFRDLGHNGLLYSGSSYGFYARFNPNATNNYSSFNNSQTPAYSPQNPNRPFNNSDPTRNLLFRFDTWHRNVDLNGGNPPGFDPPPFRAPDAVPAVGAAIRRPLRAIQIHITFQDPTTQQLRDVTFVQSLVSY